MYLYSYDGPVMAFDKCVADHWKSITYAPSEKKARSNLTYQYKLQTGLSPRAKITMPGKIKVEEDQSSGQLQT